MACGLRPLRTRIPARIRRHHRVEGVYPERADGDRRWAMPQVRFRMVRVQCGRDRGGESCSQALARPARSALTRSAGVRDRRHHVRRKYRLLKVLR